MTLRPDASLRTRLILTAVALHSLGLGALMLLVPTAMLRTSGFPAPDSAFYPSQSGIFLVILGVCYALALFERPLLKVIVVSKALAVLFLGVHAACLGAPGIIWAAAAGDAAMLAAVLATTRADDNRAAAPPVPPS